MRLGLLDVGSNSAHLRVCDLVPGQPPEPVTAVKHPTRLAEAIDANGRLRVEAVDRLVAAVGEAAGAAERAGVEEFVAFATSAVRDASNREDVVARVSAATGVELGFLSGEDEARSTFLAARAWYGWSAGELLLLDIGGGSVEVAIGAGLQASVALSLPLGAGRLTREQLAGDPPSDRQVRRLRGFVYDRLEDPLAELAGRSTATLAVATSKTFTQLAKLTGAPKGNAGPYARRVLVRKQLRKQIPRLAGMTAQQRAKLRGVSQPRARQMLAGAVVAEALMTTLGLRRVVICPWALREGIMLARERTLPHAADRSGVVDALLQRRVQRAISA